MRKLAIVVTMVGVMMVGCMAAPAKSDSENVAEVSQDSLGGTLCAGAWSALAGLGCLTVQSLCDGSDVPSIKVNGTAIPCEDAVLAACVGLTALTAAGAHVCPK